MLFYLSLITTDGGKIQEELEFLEIVVLLGFNMKSPITLVIQMTKTLEILKLQALMFLPILGGNHKF